jgi:uncharacterized membrane protein YjjP (DUF1212 family)
MRMMRVKEWGVNLDKLAAVDRIFNDVIERKLTFAEARAAIDVVEARKVAWPAPLRWIAHAAAAGAAAVFFRGGFRECGIAALGGLLLMIVFRLLRQRVRAASCSPTSSVASSPPGSPGARPRCVPSSRARCWCSRSSSCSCPAWC